MKKRIALIIALCLLLCPLFTALSGCGESEESDGLRIVCTLFPQYDWVRRVVGDAEGVEVSLLIRNGTDPHSYQPTASDILEISECDMIIYLGAASDLWVQEALEHGENSSAKRVELTKIKGMTLHDVSSHSHGHSHGEDEEHSHEGHGHGAFDEHIWLSLSNAATAVEHITLCLSELDPLRAEHYSKNAEEYIAELNGLSERYTAAVAAVPESERFVLFADRFPFVYLLSELGIGYRAAFEGCTTDVDASFDTVVSLIDEAVLHEVDFIAVTETSDGALARTVAGSSGRDIEIIAMNSLQSVTESMLSEGISYLSAMEDNLEALSRILKLSK